MASFIKQIDKICDIKELKTIPLQLKTMQPPIIKPLSRFSKPWGSNTLNNYNKWKRNLKYAFFFKKNAKVRDFKILNIIPLRLETLQ